MTRPYITVSPPPSQSSLLSHADDIIVDHFHYTHMKTANFPSRRGYTAYYFIVQTNGLRDHVQATLKSRTTYFRSNH